MEFLFDGDCAFCSACARFIERRIPTPARIRPWQSVDLAALGLTAHQCDEAVQWSAIDAGGHRRGAAGPAAIAALLRTSTPLWRMTGWALARRPVLRLAWPVYRWISRHRDRMPGGAATCVLPAEARGHPR